MRYDHEDLNEILENMGDNPGQREALEALKSIQYAMENHVAAVKDLMEAYFPKAYRSASVYWLGHLESVVSGFDYGGSFRMEVQDLEPDEDCEEEE